MQIYCINTEFVNSSGNQSITFDLQITLELIQRHNELRRHYQNRFHHILIDEFQDTNALQYKWLRLLSSSDSVVFAVLLLTEAK